MYFIIDTTRTDTKTKQDYIVTFNNIPDFMTYLAGYVERRFKKTRKDWVIDQSDYFGYTEDKDEVFYDMLKTHNVRTGVVRNGNLIDCDVLREHKYSSARAEYGD